ncbi:hypothetical protein LUZ63_010328 [Rhynchospora breviuscula]|uniref:GDSL esterase/lipase n=1 Tax=Rhynchospora breviuscula TaxID=2022672 RepID=A0A9Q0HPY4_9POAL|nr:hypothetical protein LUZ63_010328 [Rhynchospora breviuscula]
MASFISAIFFVFLALSFSITVESTLVPAIFVLGDSLADVGNNNYLDLPIGFKADYPYNGIDFPGRIPTGRFSNGFNGIDYIAMELGFVKSPPPYLSIRNAIQMQKGVNYASGGSGILQTTGNGTLTMATQVKYFADTKRALAKIFGGSIVNDILAKSLYCFVTVNNDIFAYYSVTGAANSTANAKFISNLIDEYLGYLTMVYKLGARKFAITGSAFLGCVPYIRNRNPTGDCIDELNQLSVQFNAAALPRIQQLSNQLPGFKYSYMSLYNLSTKILAEPGSFGFKELKSACCGTGKFNGETPCLPNATYCSRRTEYFYWDIAHPTQSLYNLTIQFQLYGSNSVVTPINVKQLIES